MDVRRFVGRACSLAGEPFKISVMAAYSGLNDVTPVRFFLSAAAALLTLPLAPIALVGEQINHEIAQEDFRQATRHLREVDLTEPGVTPIFIDGPDQEGTYWVDPFYYTTDDKGRYRSEQEARDFLLSEGYEEVVSYSNPYILHTFWIKSGA